MNQKSQLRMELRWGRGRSSGGGGKNNTAVFCVGAVMNGLNGLGIWFQAGNQWILQIFTPRKINIEPENTPLEKENHLPNHHYFGSMLIFGGVCHCMWRSQIYCMCLFGLHLPILIVQSIEPKLCQTCAGIDFLLAEIDCNLRGRFPLKHDHWWENYGKLIVRSSWGKGWNLANKRRSTWSWWSWWDIYSTWCRI